MTDILNTKPTTSHNQLPTKPQPPRTNDQQQQQQQQETTVIVRMIIIIIRRRIIIFISLMTSTKLRSIIMIIIITLMIMVMTIIIIIINHQQPTTYNPQQSTTGILHQPPQGSTRKTTTQPLAGALELLGLARLRPRPSRLGLGITCRVSAPQRRRPDPSRGAGDTSLRPPCMHAHLMCRTTLSMSLCKPNKFYIAQIDGRQRNTDR